MDHERRAEEELGTPPARPVLCWKILDEMTAGIREGQVDHPTWHRAQHEQPSVARRQAKPKRRRQAQPPRVRAVFPHERRGAVDVA